VQIFFSSIFLGQRETDYKGRVIAHIKEELAKQKCCCY